MTNKTLSFALAAALATLTFIPTGLNAKEMTRAELMKTIKENRLCTAGGFCPYDVSLRLQNNGSLYAADTKAPAGFKPFYVSHLGRHGSRYHTKPDGAFGKLNATFAKLKEKDLLTAKGDSLYAELLKMEEVSKGNDGILTQVGSREHKGIGERLGKRYPAIFAGNSTVNCTSTASPRCIQSMANFVTALKAGHSGLDIVYNVGLKSDFTKDDKLDKEWKDKADEAEKEYKKKAMEECTTFEDLASKFFKDTRKVEKISKKEIREFLYNIYSASIDAGCLDINARPLDFFSDEELYDLWTIYNVHHTYYGPLGPVKEYRRLMSRNFARQFVEEADEAIQGNGRCADLRFAHDGNIGPFLTLLGVKYWDKPVTDRSHLHWQGWRYLCMGSNVQFIFYRNSRGEVLAKILENELETTVPALKPVSGPYYRWPELRRYILSRADAIKEVPAYFRNELETKAARIAELQKSEADGFYFITDMHFDANHNNSPALIEALQYRCSPRKVIFGGDMMGTVHEISEGKVPAEYAFQQMSAGQPLFLLRGNHDIKNRTSNGNWEKKADSKYATACFFRFFSAPSAVFNDKDDNGCYCYFDCPSAKIRYVAFDTSDEGPVQKEWMQANALGTLPKGWKFFVLSHIPMATAPADGKDVMMMLAGHKHTDMEDVKGDVFQVLTKADTFNPQYAGRRYQESKMQEMKAGTPSEQVLDYVSISKDRKTVTMVRVGCGNERIFHLEPVSSIEKAGHRKGGKQYVFDAGSAVNIKQKGGNYVSATTNGTGSQVILTIAPDGTREFSYIKK